MHPASIYNLVSKLHTQANKRQCTEGPKKEEENTMAGACGGVNYHAYCAWLGNFTLGPAGCGNCMDLCSVVLLSGSHIERGRETGRRSVNSEGPSLSACSDPTCDWWVWPCATFLLKPLLLMIYLLIDRSFGRNTGK